MELPTDIASCHTLILRQQEQLAAFAVKLAELESRLNKNSSNSHKPPSTDGLSKPPVRKPAFPNAEGRKTGGQHGHKGENLKMVSKPDVIKNLLPSHCGCGAELSTENARLLDARQVFDLPEPKLEVTEYRRLACACGRCGMLHQGQFPNYVLASTQYGPSVKSLAVLLNVAYKIPLGKVRALFEDLYGYAVNESTVVAASRKCHGLLEASEGTIKQGVLDSVVAFFDETGLRTAGKLHWLHTACSDMYTYLFVHAKRGKDALEDAASVLPDFKNWAVHDCWESYFKFTACLHAICGAHILRELEALVEQGSTWAKLFKEYLFVLYECSEQGTAVLSESQKNVALAIFDAIWEQGDLEEPPPKVNASGRGRKKATKGRNLLDRLKKHQAALLAFAFHEQVPFTNNAAERVLRPAKTKQKVAGGFRTLDGAQVYARVAGFVCTARKQQQAVFCQLKLLFSTGTTFLTKPIAG